MPTIPDAPFSMVANAALPITATTTILAAFITPAVAAATIHYTFPQCLMEVLIAALSKAENTYIDVLQMDLLSATETEALYNLQRKVSAIHVATMRDLLSWRAGLRGFLQGRTLTVLSCIREVQGFETQIKILKEAHLRQSNLNPLCTRAVSWTFADAAMGRPWSCLLVIHRVIGHRALLLFYGEILNAAQQQQHQQQLQPPPQKQSWPPQQPPYGQPYREPYPRWPPPQSNPQGNLNAPYMPPRTQAPLYPSPPRPVVVTHPGPPLPRDHRERDRDRERERERERDRERERERERDRERDRDRERNPHEFAPHSPHPSLAWQAQAPSSLPPQSLVPPPSAQQQR
ncbi:hypothetical protein B0H13DRAFT_2524469 [Mycena leptocephala]|nr:hypothetical protein B0H13DRAFT_2524469 [Mycena leptocephala]